MTEDVFMMVIVILLWFHWMLATSGIVGAFICINDKKLIKKVREISLSISNSELVKLFDSQIAVLKKLIYMKREQHKYYNYLRNSLQAKNLFGHVDYNEYYGNKEQQEFQSACFWHQIVPIFTACCYYHKNWITPPIPKVQTFTSGVTGALPSFAQDSFSTWYQELTDNTTWQGVAGNITTARSRWME